MDETKIEERAIWSIVDAATAPDRKFFLTITCRQKDFTGLVFAERIVEGAVYQTKPIEFADALTLSKAIIHLMEKAP